VEAAAPVVAPDEAGGKTADHEAVPPARASSR
jgi:hypothetical protein